MQRINDKQLYMDEEKQALNLLNNKNQNLVEEFLRTCHKQYLGRDKELILVKLATVSRKFDLGVSVVITGTSSVGKSELINTVLSTVCEGDKQTFTKVSKNYLLYSKDPIEHKVITIFEMSGSKDAAYILRTALSEGNLSLGSVESNKKIKPIDVWKSAKGLVFLSTTTGSIEQQLDTRVIKIELTHDENLAREVYRHQVSGNKGNALDFKIWQIADHLIKPREIVINYDNQLAEFFPTNEPRYHRDFNKVLILIRASALLHQYQRERDNHGRVIAKLDDYELVYRLSDLITETISPVPASIIKFLWTAIELSVNSKVSTREEIRKALEVSEATIKRYIREATFKEFITVNGRGKNQTISVLEIPDSVASPLPQPAVIEMAQLAHDSSNEHELQETLQQ